MSHDPERDAAAFLGGAMSRRHKRAFEEHIVECEDCWREVDTGRRGRTVAESGRELAPQSLRERVRATVETVPSRPHRWRWRHMTGLFLAVLLAGAVAVSLPRITDDRQPQVIDVVLADFEGGGEFELTASPRLPRHLGDLRLADARSGRVDGMDYVVHYYEDPAGHEVAVYQSDAPFPAAAGADHAAGGRTWTADAGDLRLFCADRPVPSLVVGDDDREVALAVDELGLK